MILVAIALASATSTSPAQAIASCKTQASETCSVDWNGARLELNAKGSNQIEVRSSDGALLKWTFACKTDRVEDSRTCHLQGGTDGSITIARIYLRSGAVTHLVTWGGHKFPGSEKVAKIGSRPAMRWNSEATIFGEQAVRIIEAAKGGGPATFRWFDWPEENVHDEEVNFDSFDTVWSLFKAAVDS